MGLGPFGHSSCGCSKHTNPVVNVTVENRIVQSNPNPQNFVVQAFARVGDKYSVLEVQYPNCTNYEGRKILVTNLTSIYGLYELDPHFCEHNDTVIARFRPTTEGWMQALAFAETLK